MSLRIALVLAGFAAAALMTACATPDHSLEEAARAACEDQGIQPGPEMDVCIEQNEETLRRAREYRPPSPAPPPGRQR